MGVFEARYSEMSWMLTKNVDKNPKDGKMAEYEEFEPESDAIVKMRGLPFEAGPAEIIRFFDELPVAEKGILICKDSNRRPSGEGYCVFADEESAKEALKRDNASMGHRYIELFPATKEEALKAKDEVRILKSMRTRGTEHSAMVEGQPEVLALVEEDQ